MRSIRYISVSLLLVCLGGILAAGQEKAEKSVAKMKQHRAFCSGDSWRSDDKVSFRELREMILPASGTIGVDSGQNGGIKVRGENRSDVLVRACVQTWGRTDEDAKSAAANIRIGTTGTIKAESSADDRSWAVSYEILAPRSSNLNLKAHNGGISIGGVDGNIEFETTNGGVSLSDVAGTVKGATTNGGVNVSLNGGSWRGSGLDVTTTNGGVVLTLPENFAAHVETGTVNGGFQSDFASLTVDRKDHSRPARVVAELNGGGPPIRVLTTNGGIRIKSASGMTEKY
jgi:hypothetical protein